MAPNYLKGKIYKICSNIGNMVYIGSTTKPLNIRLSEHFSAYKLQKNWYSTYKIFEEYGIHNVHIELIESYPCENSIELHLREAYWIDYYSPNCVNIKSPVLRLSNQRRRIAAYNKRKIVCECGITLQYASKPSHLKNYIHQQRMAIINNTQASILDYWK